MLNVPLLFGAPKQPTWQWDLRVGSKPPGSTFARADASTCASYFDSSGVMAFAAANVARFDNDPLTGAPWGYLSEMQSTNACTNSQAFTGTGWTATHITVVDNAVVAPDGTTTAATFTEDATTNTRENDFSTISIVNASVYGGSIFVKNVSGSRWLQFNLVGGQNFNFQPSTGTIGSTNGSGVASVTARQLLNGWWRISCLFTAASTASTSLRLYMVPSTNSAIAASYAGDGVSAIAVWGAQFETAGVGVTSYIPTAGATVTRSQDALTMPTSGITGWDGAQGGVLVPTYRLHTLVPSTYNQPILNLRDTTTDNYVNNVQPNANYQGGGVTRSFVYSGSASQGTLNSGTTPAAFVRRKMAISWSTSRLALCNDGALSVGVSGSLSLPASLVSLDLGRFDTQSLNGTLESLAYYKGARADAFVQAVSR